MDLNRDLGVAGRIEVGGVPEGVDARLVAVDARNGRPCADFGRNGEVSLLTGMGEVKPGYYLVTSAPTIVRGRIVVGGWVADGQYWGEPSGVIRGFDAVTGRFAWAFDAGRLDAQRKFLLSRRTAAGEEIALTTFDNRLMSDATDARDATRNGEHVAVTPDGQGDVSVALASGFSVEDLIGNAATTAGGSDRSILYDATPPTVSSFSSVVTSPTNSTSIAYTLTFSESVSGIAAGDFTNAGTATGCTFTPSAASGSSITLTVTTCSTTGG